MAPADVERSVDCDDVFGSQRTDATGSSEAIRVDLSRHRLCIRMSKRPASLALRSKGCSLATAHQSKEAPRQRRLIWAGVLLGLGLGGFFDGIVLHQILQWHHMLTSEGRYPATTVAGLETNTLWDGLLHATTYLATSVGVWLLWRASRASHAPWSTRLLVGLLLMGWGTFNLVEGVVDHHILTIHHVREDSSNRGFWDIAFLVWGALMRLGGWRLAKAGEEEQEACVTEYRAGVSPQPLSDTH